MSKKKQSQLNEIRHLFKFNREYYEDRLQKKFPDISLVMNKKRPVVIYGAANLGRIFKTNLEKKGIKILAFADGKAGLWGQKIGAVKIISPDELKKDYSRQPVLIASLTYETEICAKLRQMRLPWVYPLCFLNYQSPEIFVCPAYFQQLGSLFVPQNQAAIFKLNEFWADEESRRVFNHLIKFRLTFNKSCLKTIKSKSQPYFEPGIWSFSPREVFLDCGAYTGDSVAQFYQKVVGKFKKIYSFEPDRSNFLKLRDVARQLDPRRIVPVNKGVYRSTGKVGFCDPGRLDTRIGGGKGVVFFPVVSLDDFLRGKEKATFIKMDIEGAEIEALLGAQKTIFQNKPKLAISVYHNPPDLWRIPLLIKRLNKNYRLYLRHYTHEIIDTVCYAI